MLAHPARRAGQGRRASPCAARSATSPTCSGGASCSCRCASVIGRDGRHPAGHAGVDADAGGRGGVRRAGRQDDVQRPRGRSSAMLRESGDLDGEPTPTQRMANFYEKGDKPLEIVATPAVVHPQRRPRRRPARRRSSTAGERDHLGARLHAAPLRELGRGAQRRLAGQPAAVLRRAVPGLVPRSTTTASRSTTSRSCRTRTALPVDPSSDARRASPRTQRGLPGGFVGDPDVMDTWATSSLTPQIVVRLGARRRPVRAHLPDGPAPAGARHHPHLAVLHGGPGALRERHAAVDGRRDLRVRARPGPQEDVEVQGQRGRRRPRFSRSTAPTRCGGVPRRRARAWTRRSTRRR